MQITSVELRELDPAALNDAQVVDLVTSILARVAPSSAAWAVWLEVEPDTPEPVIFDRSLEIDNGPAALAAISGVLDGSAERRAQVIRALADEVEIAV